MDKCGSAAASLRSIYNNLKWRPSSWLLFLQPDYINYAEDAENVRTRYTASTKEMFDADVAEQSKTQTHHADLQLLSKQH